VKIGIGKRITPGAKASHHAIATVRDHQAGEKLVFSFYRKIEDTAVIGACDGLKEGVPFRNGLMDIPSHTKRDATGSRDNFQRDKGTDIADKLLPFLLQLLCPDSVILIICFYRFENVALFVAHRKSPLTYPLNEQNSNPPTPHFLRGILILLPLQKGGREGFNGTIHNLALSLNLIFLNSR
jgi:hypothetical protein